MSDNEDKKPDLHTFIEPELEARIVAWVMGEASAFEKAELERLVAEKPELALFKRRIEAINGLVGEAVRPEKETLRLSPERRADLLAKISGATASKLTKTHERKLAVFPAVNWTKLNRYVPVAAACVMAFAILGVVGTHIGLLSSFDQPQAEYSSDLFAPPPPSEPSPPPQLKDVTFGVRGMAVEMEAPASRPVLQESASEPLFDGNLEKSLSDAPERMEGNQAANTLAGSRLPRSLPALKEVAQAAIDGSEFAGRGGQASIGQVAGGDSVAGKKSRTDFRDAGSAVSVETDQFMRDTTTASNDELRSYAQHQRQEPATFEEEIVVLSPFETTSDFDTGYNAPVTLAGNRLSTNLSTVEGKLDSVKVDAVARRKAEKTKAPDFQSEIQTAAEPVSTFSLHVSDVSFQLVQAAIENDSFNFDPASIRQEEFYNAFDYGDPAPMAAEKVSARIEQAAHPLMQERNLVRIAMQVPATGRGAGQPLHLTVMLDTSGSMEREDRTASVRAAMSVLASLLGPNDRVSLIGFSRTARLLEEAVPGDQAERLVDIVGTTPSEGGTNIEEALALSVNLAQRYYDPAAQNRVVLITDGAANLGNADPASLAGMIEAARQQGIAFDACGVGTDGLDDAMLETLTRKGDGRYYVLDSPADADARFARQIAGAFRPAAENVKVQVRFNPARVGSYRLIGFETHRLNEEDFRNDAVDAAELAAEEAAVALYQVEVLPEGEGELGEVHVRFRDTSTSEMVERSWTMAYDPNVRAFDQATPAMQLAGTSAIFADNLKAGADVGADWLNELAPTVNKLRGYYQNEERVQEFVRMYEKVRSMTRN